MADERQELINDIFGSESELSDVEDELQRGSISRSRSPATAAGAAGARPTSTAEREPLSPSPARSPSEERAEDEYRDDAAVRKLPKIKKKARRAEDEGGVGAGEEGRRVKRRRRERRARDRSPPAVGEEGGEERMPVELSPEERRRMELDQQLDAIIKPSKGTRRRRRKQDGDDTFMDDEVMKLKEQMLMAAIEDEHSIVEKKPALAKLRMLPEVMDLLQRQSYHEAILENRLLDAITKWLEPIRIDKSLPAMNIQNALFNALTKIDIDTEYLRQTDLGKVVLFYTKSPRVQEHIKRVADGLVEVWSRPIIHRSANYRDLNIPLASGDTTAGGGGGGQVSLSKILAEGKQAQKASSRRIRIPERNMGVYTVAPRSQVALENRAGEAEEARERRRREQERLRRLQNKLKMAKQANARV